MKKISQILLLILTIAPILSFTTGEEREITITVTSDKKAVFDMLQVTDQSNPNGEGRTVRGLSTPYTLTTKSVNGKFIFRSAKSKSHLKIKVESNKNAKKATLQADWPITVLVIDESNISAFGMD